MSAINIRRATEKDVPRIMELIRELAAYEHGLSEVKVTEADLLRDGFGDERLFHALVAEEGGQILGAAIYFYTYSTWNGKCLYLEDLIVDRNFRDRKVGGELMTALIRTAKENGARRMAWQVLDWNVDAHDFYRKFGADLDGHWLNGRLNEEQISAFE